MAWPALSGTLDSSTCFCNRDVAKELRKLMRFPGRTVGTALQQELVQLFLWLLIFATFVQLLCWRPTSLKLMKTNVIDTELACLLLILAVVTAAGTKRMLERHVFVRNLSDLETLGVETTK